jgi:RNA polymerase sigma-70 factor (ECF subfamily)
VWRAGNAARVAEVDLREERRVTASHAGPEEVRAWVRAAVAGDGHAFRRLVESHMRAVYGLAYRILGNPDDADDVAQETFVRAHHALDRYDERYSFYTWLRAIATRIALNEVAKRKRRRTEAGDAFDTASETVADRGADALARLADVELRDAVRRAMDTLPDEFRAVLVLRAEQEMSYAEIAAALDVPLGTVMSRLHRARALLRRALDREGS